MFRKSLRALELLTNLSRSELKDNTYSSEFFVVAKNYMDWKGLDLNELSSAAELISIYITSENFFTAEQSFEIHTWNLLVNTRLNLQTDDPFTFNKACQVTLANYPIKPINIGISAEVSFDPAAEDTVPPPITTPLPLLHSRIDAVLLCMKQAFSLFTRNAWSRQPIESLFTPIIRTRLQLQEDQRAQLDDLASGLTLAKRKLVSGVEGPRTIRTYNSTAHPSITKKVGVLR
jgi:hypothetical protein